EVCCYIGKLAVAVIAPNRVLSLVTAGDKQIEIAIMIVVNKRDGQGRVLGPDAGRLGYILKRSVALIVKEQDTIAGCAAEICVAIVGVVGGGACDRAQFGIEAGFLRDIPELAPAGIVKKRHSPLPSTGGKKQIRMAIIIEIKKASSGANLICFRRYARFGGKGGQS